MSAFDAALLADEEIMRNITGIVIGASLLGTVLCGQAQEPQADTDGVRASLEKWVESRRVISEEQRDWALGKEMVQERIDLVQQEIDSLNDKIADAEKSIGEADKKRVDLVKENDELKAASASLQETVLMLETSTQAFLKRLPEPIRDRVKPLSQRIPDDVKDTRLSLAERFQNIIGILNEVNKFSREITLTSEVRSLPDGSSAEVTALYVGISQAYYASADGKIAGTGTASATGWEWSANNAIAGEIMNAIAILKNEQVASFVQLPVEIK